MVFVWSNLCEGEPTYTLSQVALNDVIMVFAFAPLVGLLLGLGLELLEVGPDLGAINLVELRIGVAGLCGLAQLH